MIKILKIIRGEMRLLFGFCPACNSSAPEYYSCIVCEYEQGYPPSRELKKAWRVKFRKGLK